MRGLRYSIGLLLAAVWITPLRAQEATGTIRGRVTDEASHQPLQGATVKVGSQSTQTRTDGGYTLPDVPAGTDSLRVTASLPGTADNTFQGQTSTIKFDFTGTQRTGGEVK